MDSTTQIIVAAITGGILQAVLAYFINRRKENRVDFELMLKNLHEENEHLKERESKMMEQINSLTLQVANLQSEIKILKSKQQDE